MCKIGKLIPKPIKSGLLWIVRRPEKFMVKIYRAASHGKIPFPDKLFQKWDYKIHSGKRLSFKNPRTFNEKLQWLKYYYHNPLLTKLADKYESREYIKNIFGEDKIIKCYGVYEKWEDIDFSNMPNQFVVKCTHDSGSVYICKDKRNFDYNKCKEIITIGMKRNQFYLSREWCYKDIKPRIMIEEYLHDDSTNDLIDYKFLCFNGVARRVFTVSKRNDKNHEPCEDYFDLSWHNLKIKNSYQNSDNPPKPPINFDKMVACANTLAKGLPFVRVDFYEANGKMYFGEMTFYPSGGRIPYEPEGADREMGDWLILPPVMR